ncbi:MAG: hypothetical protein AAF564_15390 [Bacteroidota bacterium]
MKYSLYAGMLAILLVFAGAKQAAAQDQCDAISHDVNVAMWRMLAPNGDNTERDAIRDELVSITNVVLDAINKRDRQPSHPGLSTQMKEALAENFYSDFCVRKGLASRGTYNLLLIPKLEEVNMFEIRGLHLVSNQTGTEERPQAILEFEIVGSAVTLRAVKLETQAERNVRSSALAAQLDGRALEAYQIVRRLEAAYNHQEATAIDAAVREILDDSKIVDGNVEIILSQYGRQNRTRTAEAYANALKNVISVLGNTEITYEMVDVYQLNDAEDVYRVTVAQHWMYQNPNSYLDTDFLAIDVVFNGNEPVISRRQAGRGAFNIYSRPSNVQITELNGKNWSTIDPPRVTPFEQIMNAPLQYHRIRLENVWYQPVDTSRTPDEVLNLVDLMVEMKHHNGNVVLNVNPSPRGSTFLINGQNEQPVVNGSVIEIPWEMLDGVPSPDGAIVSDDRTVQIEVRHPDLEPMTFFNESITLPNPNPLTLNIPFPRGNLAASSVPTPSNILINGESVGATPLNVEMDVTPRDEPLRVQVRNDSCLPDDNVSECKMHIPSEVRPVHIRPQQTTEEVFNLMPMLFRNETGAGKITAFPIARDGDMVRVKYMIEDINDRNRKFFVDFDMDQMPGGEKVGDLEDGVTCRGNETSQTQCLGKNLRPGEYEFVWDMSNWTDTMDQNTMPVVTLRRKSTCWPCVLIPAAAGVAAAYIWPRTGSGGDDNTFIPPPRP